MNVSEADAQNLSMQQMTMDETQTHQKSAMSEELTSTSAPLLANIHLIENEVQIDDDLLNHNNINNNNLKSFQPTRIQQCLWYCIGVFLLLLSLQYFFIPSLIDHIVRDGIESAFIFTHPQPSSSHYKSWLSNSGSGSVPIWFSIRFFNLTNPDAVLLGETPQLSISKQIVYNQYYTRNNVSFSSNGKHVRHTFHTEYLFNSEMSDISSTDKFTVLSPLVSTVYAIWEESNAIEREALIPVISMFAAHPELLFWRDKTAAQLIWDVYNFTFKDYSFSWGFMRNESDQYYITHTGHSDVTKMGEVIAWCREPQVMSCIDESESQWLSQWNPPMLLSPGRLFYFGLYALNSKHKNDIAPLWIDILYRNVYLTFNSEKNFKGITLWEYDIAIDTQLLNATEYPPNAQFNQWGPSGILNLTSAYGNIAIYLSMVLFYGAPDYQMNNTKLGLPKKESKRDRPFIQIEPITGAVFYANASMQICTPIHSLPVIGNETGGMFNITNDMMIPIYLVTYSDELSDKTVNNYKANLDLGSGLHSASVVCGYIAISLFIIWISVYAHFCGVWYAQKRKQKYNYHKLKPFIVNN